MYDIFDQLRQIIILNYRRLYDFLPIHPTMVIYYRITIDIFIIVRLYRLKLLIECKIDKIDKIDVTMASTSGSNENRTQDDLQLDLSLTRTIFLNMTKESISPLCWYKFEEHKIINAYVSLSFEKCK